MPDTGKTIRVARTNIGEPNINGLPTQHSQLVANEVHQFRSSAEGLEGLSQVFGDFFGSLQRTTAVINDGVLTAQKAQIDQENAAQKRQGIGDALSGKPMDTKLSGDMDYYDAFRSVTAQRDGYKAAMDFNQFYLQDWLPQNPTGDLMKARQEWAAKNLMGSADTDYQGRVLSSFFDQTDPMIAKHQEFAFKYQTAKGMEALGSALDSQVAAGTMDAGKLADYVEKAKVLDPLNSAEAPARVATMLLSSAESHPEQMMAVSNLLSQDGTGVNGKSFAASWPDTYADFQNKAVNAWNGINTTKDLASITDFEDRLRNAKSADDLASLTADVMAFRQQRGGVAKTNEILNSISSAMTKIDAKETALQGVDGFMSGDTGAASPADVRKNWSDWLQRATATQDNPAGTKNIMDVEPPLAVKMLEHLQGVVPEEAKAQLSAALTNTQDTAGQAKAIGVINALSDHVGKAYAHDYLSDTAGQLYDTVWAISQTTSEPIDSIVSRVNSARSGIKDWNVDWKTITSADTQEKATAKVDSVVNDEFFKALGKSGFLGIGGSAPQLPNELHQTILDVARQDAILANATGLGWEQGVRNAVQKIAANAEVIPTANGGTVVQLNANRTQAYVDDNGKDAVRPRLGFAVTNPVTGQPVDTIQVFKDQLQQLDTAAPWTMPNGDTSGIGLSPVSGPMLSARGLMAVTNDNVPIVFAAGDEVTLQHKGNGSTGFTLGTPLGPVSSTVQGTSTTTKVKLPADEKAMDALFGDSLPEGFKFFRIDTPKGVTWQLTYRPNFGKNAGLSLDDQIARNGGGW